MRGILSSAGYLPHHRLRLERIAAFHGGTPSPGTRSVASYDEDTTTLGVAAARLALRTAPTTPRHVTFATTSPAYLDKTNATAIHAALRLDRAIAAADMNGAARSATQALLAALRTDDPTLVVAADVRTGLPNGPDEREGGDAAAALLTGTDADGPLVAALLGAASVTEEFLDRWRPTTETTSRRWEERFGETRYVPLAEEAYTAALKAADLTPDTIDRLVVTGLHSRATRQAGKRLAAGRQDLLDDDLTGQIGNAGGAHALLLLVAALEQAGPGETIALVHLGDGADAMIVRATDDVSHRQAHDPITAQLERGNDDLPYARFLTWRGHLAVEPPRRPEPARVSASAAARNTEWKYGFVGSRDIASGALHLPPARVSFEGDAIDEMEPAPMADVLGTVTTFTVDRLAWSPSPPTVFAIVDFDGGGRFACELTDVAAEAVAIGDRVEMTFRLKDIADGIRNYVWKARPADGAGA